MEPAPGEPHVDGDAAPTWSTLREALAVIVYGPNLRRTILAAFVVGTILFCINQLDVVLHGHATPVTYVKGLLTFLVPFCVSNYGILVASHSPRQ
jgi:hypothetical protein